MSSADYWERAALKREIAIQENAGYTAKEIIELYEEALDDINEEIRKIRINFQKRFGLDNDRANFFLTKAQNEENLKWLTEALENAPDNKEKEGENCPVMHPRCRCTTTLNIDYHSRRVKDPVTGKYSLVDGNTTYSKWVEGLNGEQKAALDLARKKYSRKTSDKLQHEQYKKLLGTKIVPKSFDKFQELKYNNS